MRRNRAGVFDDAGRLLGGLDRAGPCSPNQWGRVRREFGRLGLDLDGADLDTRLMLTGLLAGRSGAVTSTRDLTAAEAGQVGRLLGECATLADARWLADEPRRERQRARQREKTRALLRSVTERMVTA